MTKHKRRNDYWKFYHMAHTQEPQFVVENIVSLVEQNPPPIPQKKSRRGKKPVHSTSKMACICMLMVMLGMTYSDIQKMVPFLRLPWNEPFPDHTWIARFFDRIPTRWLEEVLARTASLCIAESGWKKGLVGADSTPL